MTINYNDYYGTALNINVTDGSYRYRAIKGEHTLTLYYSLDVHAEVPVGATCTFQGETYTLIDAVNLKKHHNRSFEYTLIMHSQQYKLGKYKLKDSTGRLKFTLTGKPLDFLNLIVTNMNNRDSGWSIGSYLDVPEKPIQFNHVYLNAALETVSNEFETEWEIVGKTISLKKVEYNKASPLALSYGMGNGFKSGVGRVNEAGKMPIEILFVQGGERNIDPSKYGSQYLLLPKSKSYYYQGSYYTTDATGSYIQKYAALTHANEDSLDLSNIYPSRVGTISSVVTVDATKHFYNFVDSSIPVGLDYSACQISGEKMTVIFQSGQLAGLEFDISKYTHATRTFEIVPQEIGGRTMPDASYIPTVGMKYAIFGIQLPDAYISDDWTQTGASWDMFKQAAKYLYENSEQRFTFSGMLDGIWAKTNWWIISSKITVGGYINFSDPQFAPDGKLIRITGLKDYINNPYSPEIELSNSITGATIRSELGKIDAGDVKIETSYKDSINFTRRNFRDAMQTIDLLESSLLDFSHGINPMTVHTMSILAGDESLQFRFVNSKVTPSEVALNATWNNSTKKLSVASTKILQHMTIGVTTISSTHAASEYTFWDMNTFLSTALTAGSKSYYLYAKVKRTSPFTGDFILSETPIAVYSDGTYYHFLTGVLNSEVEGDRSFVELYGFTEILPGRITTNKIVSADGKNYIDFVNNAARIGNDSNYIDFNSGGLGKLLLKGVFVQNSGGSEELIGLFRGVYNAGYTYYKGDEVVWTNAGATATYRYIYATPSSGNAPSNATYWQIIAKGADGANGTNGTNGAFFEYRYAKNGSTTTPPALANTDVAPSGWSTTMPALSGGEYLWVTVAKKTADGSSLLINWGTPTRITGADGAKGDSPAMVFRGNYDGSATYYGTATRVDCVKYSGAYYIARTDAGSGFSGHLPTDTDYWNSFGASFESVATNLLLAENATIADWTIKDGKITSQAVVTGGSGAPRAQFDGANGKLTLKSNIDRYTASGGTTSVLQTLTFDSSSGEIKSEDEDNNISIISSQGILANRAGTQAVPYSSGMELKAAIAGLGFGNLNKSAYSDTAVMCGVYGAASNSSATPAPTFGGYFVNLFASGLALNVTKITSGSPGTTYMNERQSIILGLHTSGVKYLYLPDKPQAEGTIVYAKQLNGGTLSFYPPSGAYIFDDSSSNAYYNATEGETLIFFSVILNVSGTNSLCWIVNKIKF